MIRSFGNPLERSFFAFAQEVETNFHKKEELRIEPKMAAQNHLFRSFLCVNMNPF